MNTFAQIDQHVDTVGTLPPVNAANPIAQLCTYYNAAKPLIVMVEGLPFFPAKWKTVLTGFLGLLDTICAQP